MIPCRLRQTPITARQCTLNDRDLGCRRPDCPPLATGDAPATPPLPGGRLAETPEETMPPKRKTKRPAAAAPAVAGETRPAAGETTKPTHGATGGRASAGKPHRPRTPCST